MRTTWASPEQINGSQNIKATYSASGSSLLCDAAAGLACFALPLCKTGCTAGSRFGDLAGGSFVDAIVFGVALPEALVCSAGATSAKADWPFTPLFAERCSIN